MILTTDSIAFNGLTSAVIKEGSIVIPNVIIGATDYIPEFPLSIARARELHEIGHGAKCTIPSCNMEAFSNI